jgi:hypothetical protein
MGNEDDVTKRRLVEAKRRHYQIESPGETIPPEKSHSSSAKVHPEAAPKRAPSLASDAEKGGASSAARGASDNPLASPQPSARGIRVSVEKTPAPTQAASPE